MSVTPFYVGSFQVGGASVGATATGSILASGTVAVAGASLSTKIGIANAFTLANAGGTSSYGYYDSSSITTTSGTTSILASVAINSILTNNAGTTTTTVAGLLVTPSITNSTLSSVITNPTGIYIKPTFTGTITLSNVYGHLIDTITSGGGTITTAYGSYVKVPTAGTTNVALYADNMAIGTAATLPPTNGLLVNGNIINSALTASSLVATDGSKNLTSSTSGLSPTFTGLTLSGLTSALLWANASHVLAAVTLSANFAGSFAGTLDTVQGIQTTSNPQFNSLGIGVASSGTAGTIYANVGLGVGVTPPTTAGYAQINARLGLASAPSSTIGFINAISFTGAAAAYYGQSITSNFTFSSGSVSQSGVIFIDGTAANITTTGGTISTLASGIINNVKLINTSGTFAAAYGYYSLPVITGTTTIGTYAGIYLNTPTITGTVTTSYGIFNNAPVAGATNYGYNQTGTFTKANDVGMQINHTFTPTATGTLYLTSLSSTFNSSAAAITAAYGSLLAQTFNVTSTMTTIYGNALTHTYTVSSTGTVSNIYCYSIVPTVNVTTASTGTRVSNIYGISIAPAAPTITTASTIVNKYYGIYSGTMGARTGSGNFNYTYGGYFLDPTTTQPATGKNALYTDNIQVGGTNSSNTAQNATYYTCRVTGTINSGNVVGSIYSDPTLSLNNEGGSKYFYGAALLPTFSSSGSQTFGYGLYIKIASVSSRNDTCYSVASLYLDTPTAHSNAGFPTITPTIEYGIYNSTPYQGKTNTFGYYQTNVGAYTQTGDTSMYVNGLFTPTVSASQYLQQWIGTFNTTSASLLAAYGQSITTTFNCNSANNLIVAYGSIISPTITISSSGYTTAVYGQAILPTVNVTTATVGTALTSIYGLYVTANTPTITTASVVVTNYYGVYCGTMPAKTGSGNFANAYSGFFASPVTTATTTSSMAVYADNMSIGTSNISTSPPTNGILVQGNILNQALAVSSLVGTDASKNLTTTTSAITATLAGLSLTSALTVSNGGTGLNTCNLGNILYGNGTNTMSLLPGNVTTSRQFLGQTGDGVSSAAPVWTALAASDFGTTLSPQFTSIGLMTAAINDAALVTGSRTASSAGTTWHVKLAGTTTASSTTTTTTALGCEVINKSNGATLTNATQLLLTPYVDATNNTITNSYAMIINAGTNVAGTVTNFYGIYNSPSTYATNNTGYYQAATFIKSTDDGMILNDTFSPTAAATLLTELSLTTTYNPTSGPYTVSAFYNQFINPTITKTSASIITTTAYYGLSVAPVSISLSGAAHTIGDLYGIYSSIPTPTLANSSTITRSYGGYFANPGAGTSNVALYTDSLLVGGSSVTTAMTAGTFKIGTTGAGVICAPSSLGISATSGFIYIPSLAGSTTGPTGGAPTSQSGTVPMVYDTDNSALLCYNSGWKPVGECLIQKQVLANSTTTTVTFSNIPQHFNRLKIVFVGQVVSGTAGSLLMAFNGGTASYEYEFIQASHTTVSSTANSFGASAEVGVILGDTATSTPKPSQIIIDIPEYAGSTWYKSFQSSGGYATTSTSGILRIYTGSSKVTTNITTITFTNSAGGGAFFKTGSVFYLYGIV